MVETRGMTWNFPVGNEDILYFIYTFYNITSTNAADYAAVRPTIQPVLLERAQKFHDIALQRFGFNVPAGGYTINNLFAAFSADMDVAEAGRQLFVGEPAVRAGLRLCPRLRGCPGVDFRSLDLQAAVLRRLRLRRA